MALDPHSQEGQTLRKYIPLATMPAQQFNLLCNDISVEKKAKGDFLFKINDPTESFIYLIEGSLSLEEGALKVDSIDSSSESVKFALAHHFPRKISARATSNISYISLGLNVFDQPGTDYEEKESVFMVDNDDSELEASNTGDWMSVLLKSPIFQRLPPMNLQQVLMSLEEITLDKGDVLFHQGDVGDYFYLVRVGRCALSRKASARAKEIKLVELGANETFGEDSLLSGEPRSMTITAMSDMVLSRIDKSRFIKLIKEPALDYIDYQKLLLEQGKQTPALILDLRPNNEFNESHIEGSHNIPFFSLRMHLKDLKKEAHKIILVCANGAVSEAAAFTLIKNKVDAVILKGGIKSLPNDFNSTKESTFSIDNDDQEQGIILGSEDFDTKFAPEEEPNLEQDNEVLKADNARLNTELNDLKKKYRMLYAQFEKLKAILDKLRSSK